MSRKFIGAILGAALTVTTFSAAPARANNDDLARFLGAAATLFIIGKAIESHNDKPRARAPAQTHPKPRPQAHQAPRPSQHSYGKPQRERANHIARRPAPLPSGCMFPVRRGDTRFAMGARCLNRHYTSSRPLPRACKIKTMTRDGHRKAYSVRCLRQNGYKIARW